MKKYSIASVIAMNVLLSCFAGEDQIEIKEIKGMIVERCQQNKDNTLEECRCVADEVFKRFTLDELIKVNSRKVSDREEKIVVDWFVTNPCGASYRLND